MTQTPGNTEAIKMAAKALCGLRNRDWHGNVRELRNSIERALILARDGVVLKEHLPAPLPSLHVSATTAKRRNDAVDHVRMMIRDWAIESLSVFFFGILLLNLGRLTVCFGEVSRHLALTARRIKRNRCRMAGLRS